MTEIPPRTEIGTQTEDSSQKSKKTVYTQTENPEIPKTPNMPRRPKTQKPTKIKITIEEVKNKEDEEEEKNIISNEEEEEGNEGSGNTGEQNGDKNNKDEELKTIINLININILLYSQILMALNMQQYTQELNKILPLNNTYCHENLLINLILESLCQKGLLNRPIQGQYGNYGYNLESLTPPIQNNRDYFYNQPIPRNGPIIPSNNLTSSQANVFDPNSKNNGSHKNLDNNTDNNSSEDLNKDKNNKDDGKKDKNNKESSIKSQVTIDTKGLIPILITGGLTATAMYVCPIMAPLALVAFLVFLCKNKESVLGGGKTAESKGQEKKPKEPIKTPQKTENPTPPSESPQGKHTEKPDTPNESPKNQNPEKPTNETNPLPENPNGSGQIEPNTPNKYPNEQKARETDELLEQENLKRKVENMQGASQDIGTNVPYQPIPQKA